MIEPRLSQPFAISDLSRLAINQATTRAQWNLRQAIEGYSKQGVRRMAVWRDKLNECGVKEAQRILKDNGMSVTGYNRVGPLYGVGAELPPTTLDDDFVAIQEAAAIGAECVLVFTGGLPRGEKDISGARHRALERINQLLPCAKANGVKLAIEPLHPMFAADRSFVNTLEQGLSLCESLGDGVGMVIDVYHVWWDPQLETQIARIGAPRILGFHISDWLVPTPDMLVGRGMMGDGVIDLRRILTCLEKVGYKGAIEVELFSKYWWAQDPNEVVRVCIQRFLELV